MIILDGIRYDLVDGSKINSQNKYNLQLQIFQKWIKQNPTNSLLLESYADLPTVTMQRVKAMMIGDIPQFIEISNNFNAQRVKKIFIKYYLNYF